MANARRKRYSIPRKNGLWPTRGQIDSSLHGPKAWLHPSAVEWRRWARDELEARWDIILLTPCSNVKPYPRSPQSAKIRGVLRRLGLWNPEGVGLRGEPWGVDWLYVSDLLGLVPYTRSQEYPACCYEFPPQALNGNLAIVISEIRGVLRGFLSRNRERIRAVIAYLPRFYRLVAEPILESFKGDLEVVWARFHLFHGHKTLEEALLGVLRA